MPYGGGGAIHLHLAGDGATEASDSMIREFEKIEGLGNDFVVVHASDAAAVTAAEARAICDRRFGVGADGVLLVLPPVTSGAVGRMRVLNADGSVPEMCGNGLRCVVLALAAAASLEAGQMIVDTDAGPRACAFAVDGDTALVTVDMGVVRVLEDLELTVGATAVPLTRADAGNPHAVTFMAVTDEDIRRLGAALTGHEAFPQGANIEFARIQGAGIDVVVWERGVGLTLACGTGACATAAAACKKGFLPYDVPMSVRLPGGALTITVARADGRVQMRGPARRVFRGTWRA